MDGRGLEFSIPTAKAYAITTTAYQMRNSTTFNLKVTDQQANGRTDRRDRRVTENAFDRVARSLPKTQITLFFVGQQSNFQCPRYRTIPRLYRRQLLGKIFCILGPSLS